MIINVFKEGSGKKSRLWQFQVNLSSSAVSGNIRYQLVRYVVLKEDRSGRARVISQWTDGWDSNMAWTDVHVPQYVMKQVKEQLMVAAEYGEFWCSSTRLGNKTEDEVEELLNQHAEEDSE